MKHKLCHRFTLQINKQYFTSLKLSFGILANISASIKKKTGFFLSVWFLTWQINLRPDRYATPNLGVETG